MTCIYISQRKSNEPNVGDRRSPKRNKCSRWVYRHMLRSSNVSLRVFHRPFSLRILLLLEMQSLPRSTSFFRPSSTPRIVSVGSLGCDRKLPGFAVHLTLPRALALAPGGILREALASSVVTSSSPSERPLGVIANVFDLFLQENISLRRRAARSTGRMTL